MPYKKGCESLYSMECCTSRSDMVAARSSLLLILSILYGADQATCACNVSALSSQLDAMLAEYDRETAPAQPVRVRIALDVRHASLADGDTVFKVLADLNMEWSEPRLSWNASEWGCPTAATAAGRLWTPDVAALNAAAAVAAAGGLRARLSAGGEIAYSTRLELRAPLRVDLAAWPTDTQTATIVFASTAHSDQEIQLEIGQTKHSVWESGAWEMRNISPQLSTGSAPGWSRAQAAWTLTVRRNAPAQVAGAQAALAAALLLLFAAVVLPARARAPLAAAAAFIAALWLSSSLSRLASGAGCPHLVRLMCAVCVLAAATCAGTALGERLARRTVPAPAVLRGCLRRLAGVLRVNPAEEAASGTARVEWAAAARLLDCLALAALAVLMLAALCLVL